MYNIMLFNKKAKSYVELKKLHVNTITTNNLYGYMHSKIRFNRVKCM